jgi:hypothetical protein
VTGTRKLALTAVLFAVAVGIVAIAAATKRAEPLFAAWIPLIGLAWVLAQPPPGERRAAGPERGEPGESDPAETA